MDTRPNRASSGPASRIEARIRPHEGGVWTRAVEVRSLDPQRPFAQPLYARA